MKLYNVALQKWYENMKQAPYSWNMFMLLLAGKKLIFSPVANMWLCSGFVLEALLIIQGSFPFCWAILMQSQGLFCLSHPPAASRLHVPSWVKAEGWRLKAEGWRMKDEGDVPSGGDCPPESLSCVVESCSPGGGWTLGSGKWAPCFALLACTALGFLVELTYLNPWNFSLSLFSFSSQTEWWRTE